MRYKRGALVGLVATGGGSYAAYELSDTFSPLSYSLDVPAIPTLEHSEDALPVVNFPNVENPKQEESGAQPADSDSRNVKTKLPTPRRIPESQNPAPEKEQNQMTESNPTPEPIKAPSNTGAMPVVQTDTKTNEPLDHPVVTLSTPFVPPKKSPPKPVAKPTPKSPETIKKEAQEALQSRHQSIASSAGLKVVNDYNAHNLDSYSDNPNVGVKVKTFVVGEDANYMKNLWNNSIAIKHRRFWNLAPDDDPIWDQQLASAQKRILAHSYGTGDMYAYVFGSFSLKRNGRWPHLNAKSLARRCKENLERTPWGTWWSAARARYWMLLWDFCAKPDLQKNGIPWDIGYWYRDQTGDRKDSDFKKYSS